MDEDRELDFNVESVSQDACPVVEENEILLGILSADEVLVVFEFLSDKDLAECALVCKRWKELTRSMCSF